jgi:translation initiation factor 3 subunit J
VKPPPEMAPKKPAVKSTEKKGNTTDVVKDQPLDPLAEKLRQQRYTQVAASISVNKKFEQFIRNLYTLHLKPMLSLNYLGTNIQVQFDDFPHSYQFDATPKIGC